MTRSIGRITRSAPRALCYALATALVLGLVSSAFAFVPAANRTLKAIAKTNRASGRTKAIQLELTMRIGDREPVATGELISHPSGLARLELRGYRGRTDRYLLSGSELLAAKDGQRLDRPQPMLQPFFLLQPASETTLRAALETFGVETEWIGLAPCGEQDCFVIGDPRLAVPLPSPVDPVSDEQDVLDDPLGLPESELGSDESGESDQELLSYGDRLAGPVLALPEDGLIPRFWVDVRELQVRRIDRKSGVFIVFGPMVDFEKLKVPAWFEIHEPGAQTIRFEVDRAVQVNAPPQAFSRKWLLAPVDPPTPTTPTTSASDGRSHPPAISPAPDDGTGGPASR
jgi:hypothetical protein